MDIRSAIILVESMTFDKFIVEGTEANAYPDDMFYLPTDKIVFYDDPYDGEGDDGWDVESMKKSIAKNGQRQPIEVGRSMHDMEVHGSQDVAAYNGNHRLAACKELKVPMMLCLNSEADDADPLTIAEIIAMGGKIA